MQLNMDRDIRIVVVITTVLLVIEIVGLVSGPALCLLAVDKVRALGLSEPVDLPACKACEQLFGDTVVHYLACNAKSACDLGSRLAVKLSEWDTIGGVGRRTLAALVVLKRMHGFKGCSASNQLVAEAGLVILTIVVVDLVTGVLALVVAEHFD